MSIYSDRNIRILYDLTYQKGLRRLNQLDLLQHSLFILYDLTYQKGLRLSRFNHFYNPQNIIVFSMT